MKSYNIYFEIQGKSFKSTFEAFQPEAVRNKVIESIRFKKVIEVGLDKEMIKPLVKKNYFLLFNNVALSSLLLWILSVNAVQMWKCPSMTQMEIFLNIPNSFILEFNSCE